MPEFILSQGSSDDAKRFNALSSMAQGIAESIFFTADTEHNIGTDEEPMIEDLTEASFGELAPEAVETIKRYAETFENLCGPVLMTRTVVNLIGSNKHIQDECDALQAIGRDIWYTGQGQGVGFWSRDAIPSEDGETLSQHAKQCVSEHVQLYRGDDGNLYL